MSNQEGKRISIFNDKELFIVRASIVSVYLIAQQQDEDEVPPGFIEAVEQVLSKIDSALEIREQELEQFEAIVEQSLLDVKELTPAILKEETE